MGYLISNDYNRLIQDPTLQQLISGSMSLVMQAENSAIAKVKSHLVQKYDIDSEFTSTVPYNPAAIYQAANRVYLTALAYNAAVTYTLNSLTLQNGQVYQCTTAITAPEAFNAAHWQLLGNQYDIFYCVYPFPVFELTSFYPIGANVFWKNNTYSAIFATRIYTHDDYIQFHNTNNIPYSNVFPDNPFQGAKYWQNNGAYTIPARSLLNQTYFVPGDNRNQELMIVLMDIVIYYLYKRIDPQAIPARRAAAYNEAMGWLVAAATGNDITADLPKKQPAQGRRIRYGSNIKQDNSY